MSDLSKLHDEALEHEHSILSDVEILSDLRVKMYDKKDKEVLKEISPVLNAIIYDTKKYIEWLEEKALYSG